MKRITAFLTLAITLLAACAEKKEGQAALPTDGKAEGTLTINGESFPLKYIYTGRTRPGKTADFMVEVLITTEPLSYESLSKIFHEMNIGFSYKGLNIGLKGESLKAIYFKDYEFLFIRDGADGNGTLSCSEMMMTPDVFVDRGMAGKLEAVNFKGGTLSAKAMNEWEKYEADENNKNIKIAASYSVSFEARVREESLMARSFSSNSKTWQAASSALPEQGKAEGSLTRSGKTIQLKYAYAMKPKRAELGEEIKVLLTNKPLPKEYLLMASESELFEPDDFYVLYLGIHESSDLSGSAIIGEGANYRFDEKAIRGFKLEGGRISGSVENRETIEGEGERDSYSVSFDAPLKNS